MLTLYAAMEFGEYKWNSNSNITNPFPERFNYFYYSGTHINLEFHVYLQKHMVLILKNITIHHLVVVKFDQLHPVQQGLLHS